VDTTISRLSSISDSTATLEAYTYLGLDTVVKRAHPQPGVDLTYIKQSGESNGDAGDQYTGLDRFGRVVDQRWLVTSTGTATDRFQYGYDRDSNRLYRNNLVNTSFGELYHVSGAGNGYDGLNQLVAFSRGVLSASGSTLDTIASPSHSQSWTFDALGNWTNVTTDGNSQNRSANKQNEITSITGLTTPGYDHNGNTTTDQAGKTLVYDAWNRFVSYKSGSTVLESDSYDALGRRNIVNPGTATTLFYSSAWQVLEERQGSSTTAQYVWSPVYIDALIERDRGSERFYAEQDANWNVTSIIDATGAVKERYIEDPYGSASVLAPDWSSRSSSLFAWIYLHQGGRFGTTSGLIDFRNRDYSPLLGRWMEMDPLGFQARDTDLYRYVGNSPSSLRDPNGERISRVDQPTKANNCTMTVYLDVTFYDIANLVYYSGGSSRWRPPSVIQGEEGTALVRRWQHAVETIWSGKSTDGKIKFRVKGNFTLDLMHSNFLAVSGPNRIEIGPPNYRSYVSHWFFFESGEWAMNDTDRETAHEAGHLMGLQDYYQDVTQPGGGIMSAPMPGWEGTLMADAQNGSPSKPSRWGVSNIDQIIDQQLAEPECGRRVTAGSLSSTARFINAGSSEANCSATRARAEDSTCARDTKHATNL
jgi:RHS repeat-associated protein